MSENKKLNVLFFGLSTINTAHIQKFKESPLLNKIYVISNIPCTDKDCIYAGTSKDMKISELKSFLKDNEINLICVFSELYFMNGFVDYIKKHTKVPIIGTSKDWFNLEFSKLSGKYFMQKNNIKTPDYFAIQNEEQIKGVIYNLSLPIVIKNTFLQGGFGSYICKTEKEAVKIGKYLLKKYKVCIAEKFLAGSEISQTYLWDGVKLVSLLPVRDYKKSKENNEGINTGGMGCYTPVKLTTQQEELLAEYNRNLSEIFEKEKPDFTGIITANLLFAKNDLFTLEFNMRPGITEFEALLEHMSCDALKLMYDCATGNIDANSITYKEGVTGCVAVAHKDYCKQNNKDVTSSMERSSTTPFDNTIKTNLAVIEIKKDDKVVVNTSKRFLSVLCTDKKNPFERIYQYIDTFKSKDLFYRKDIGSDCTD